MEGRGGSERGGLSGGLEPGGAAGWTVAVTWQRQPQRGRGKETPPEGCQASKDKGLE